MARDALRQTPAFRPIALVIEDDEGPRLFYRRVLVPHTAEILMADAAPKGLSLAIGRQPHSILLDLRLGRDNGLDVFADLRFNGVLAHVLAISGFWTPELRARARTLGALAILDKPVTADQLAQAFHAAMAAAGPVGGFWRVGFEGTAAEKWVSIVLRSLRVPRDPRISEVVAARAAISLSQMKAVCHDAELTAHQTCGLARMLGGLVWARRLNCTIESLMNVGDERTLEKLIEAAGVPGITATATVRHLLDRQQFVPHTTLAFRLLRRALLGEPLDAKLS
jgi:DNA-binding response OmpR family regulator